jgi:hypothetical protein
MSSESSSIVLPDASGPVNVARAVTALVAIDSSVRVMVGTIHASLDHDVFASSNPAIWIWTTTSRVPATLFHESTFERSLEQAHRFLERSFSRAAANQRASDEAEGGIIIPDYMY